MTIPFQHQIEQLLHRNSEYLSLNAHLPNDEICDVHDAQCFQSFREKIGNTPCITLTFSTDGAAIFKATKDKSVWPIQFIINEIGLEHRFKKRKGFMCSNQIQENAKYDFFSQTVHRRNYTNQ